MDPIDGAVEAFNDRAGRFETYILSTAPCANPFAWSDKLLWVKKHLEPAAHKRLIITHHKNLNKGDLLIDDRIKHGVDLFRGEHIHFGSAQFPDWTSVMAYLRGKEK